MNRARSFSLLVTAASFVSLVTTAQAQLNDYIWNNPALIGPQNWQVNGNWNQANFPNDPGRTEPDVTVIVPSVGANPSVALTGDLTLNVGATDVTVASLKIGGTLGAVTTNISGGGGRLVFENYEANDTTPVDPLPDICSFNCGAAQITSAGVANSTNIISAPVHLNGERLEISPESTNNLTISGNITFANLTAPASASSIRSFMPTGTKLTISGGISLVDTVTTAGAQLTLNDNGTAPPVPPGTGTVNRFASGTVEISGVITDATATTGTGTLMIGTTTANAALGTVILSGTNNFRGRTTLNRANLVLANNSALGVDSALGNDRSGGAVFGNGNPSQQFGFNLQSDNDTRTITVDAQLAQWQTVNGQNSLTWAGMVTQQNARGWVNLLPAGKTLTVSGVTYAQTVSDTDTSADNRIFTYDGTGTTVVTGGWRDKIKGGVSVSDISLGHFRKAGTGTLLVSDPGAVSDFEGDVIVDQGVVRFSVDTIYDSARVITSVGGAIGVDTGTFTNATLLQRLDTSTVYGTPNLNHGGLMLTAGEAGAGIDFTMGDLANITKMSVAAPQNGITYTGTILPATDALTSVPTYRLGGGNGTLTIPGNKLMGASNVQVTNGGEVVLTGNNSYSGVTRIQAKYHTTTQNQAIANTTTNISNVVYEGTTLTVNSLPNGGANSPLGSSSSAASNLVIQGSTLKYTGGGNDTDRLFTVGTGGATIDASGAGALRFQNTGALAMGVAGSQSGSIVDTGTNVNDGVTGGVNTRARVNVVHVDDIVTGMTVAGLPSIAAGVAISAINNPTPTFPNLQVSIPAVAANTNDSGTVTFGGVARTLTLSGSSTADNTLNPLVADAAAAAGVNTVGVSKTGTGKWILTGDNTYTGTTTVNAGTLLINGTQTGTGAVTVAAGATLGGTGTLGGAVTNNGIIAPGASVGTLTQNGNVTMAANSSLAIELLGATADKLAVAGNLDLSALGNSLNVTGVGTGTSWIIGSYTGTLTGTFESITPGYSVNYGSLSNGVLTLNQTGPVGVPGDYNNNGTVDAADYVLWRNGGPLQNEVDAPGTVNAADYTAWRARFGNTSGSGSGSGSSFDAVPEPATLGLVALGCLALTWTRRRS